MKRKILEAVFPEAKGKYKEGGDNDSWWAYLSGDDEDIWKINVSRDLFWSNRPFHAIPLKAITLLAKYIENET